MPPELEGLRRLAYNLYWTWHPKARGLFARINSGTWARTHSPIPVLTGMVDWSGLLDNPDFMAEAHRVIGDFDRYMGNGADHWFHRKHARELGGPIAYFCAEYGLHESLGIYSGGLGVLAGDHMKSASDMALPLVGVGLLYRNGYFRQTIDADGHQEHRYPDYDLSRLPLTRALDREGEPLTVTVELPGRDVRVDVWTVQVGRVPVLLLDTDNARERSRGPPDHPHPVRPRPRDAPPPGAHPGRRRRSRPARAGHRARRLAPQRGPLRVPARRAGPGARRRRARRSTTRSGPGRAGTASSRSTRRSRRATSGSTPTWSGASPGRSSTATAARTPAACRSSACSRSGAAPDGDPSQFDMTAFSLRLTNGANAVSQLHAETANATWQGIAPHGIMAITNGVHAPTWVGAPIRELLRALPRRRPRRPRRLDAARRAGGSGIDRIPAAELWEAHLRQKRELAVFARGRLRSQFARHGEAPRALQQLGRARSTRRSSRSASPAGSRRTSAPGMIFTDPIGWRGSCADEERPVQIVFAGKAHPADRPGQAVIQEIFGRTRSPELRGRVFILEDYDMRIARFLVQGVDVWLNNPRRPLEASGTSGMKAAVNGVVNLSVLDGWWDEGWTGDNGWAIGGRETDRRRGRPGLGRRAWTCTGSSRTEVVPALLRPRRGRPAAALGRADAALDGDDPVALLDDADAPRVHRAALPPGRRRST